MMYQDEVAVGTFYKRSSWSSFIKMELTWKAIRQKYQLLDRKIPGVPSRPILAAARNKYFTAFHIPYANFPHAAVFAACFFFFAFLSYLKISP